MSVNYSNTTSSLTVWIKRISERIKRQLVIDKTVASRRTLNSIGWKSDGLTAFITSEQAKGSELSLLELIDQGRRSGKPPSSDRILEWMEAKGVQPRRNGKPVRKTDKNIRDSAFAIAQAIGNKGTIKRFGYKGSDLFSFVTNPVIDEMTQEILTAYTVDVERYILNRGKG